LPTTSFAPQPQQQTGFAANSPRAAHVFAMAAARAELFFGSLKSFILKSPQTIKNL
jgi:hypothetical protein